MSSVSLHSYTEVLNPDTQNVTVFGDRFFKRQLSYSEVVRMALMQRCECPQEKTGLGCGHVKRDHPRMQREDTPSKSQDKKTPK